VVGAGVGLESVVVGRVARRLWVNDIAPVALELQLLQLQENGIKGAGAMSGSFGEIVLPDGVELVMGCFVVYDPGTAKAMEALLEQTRRRGVAALLADMDIGGHFSRLLQKQDGPVQRIPVPGGTDEAPNGTNEPIQIVVVG
jgi:predicted nicotinamide N-methyase